MKKLFSGILASVAATPAMAHPAQVHTLSHGAEAVIAALILGVTAVAVHLFIRKHR